MRGHHWPLFFGEGGGRTRIPRPREASGMGRESYENTREDVCDCNGIFLARMPCEETWIFLE